MKDYTILGEEAKTLQETKTKLEEKAKNHFEQYKMLYIESRLMNGAVRDKLNEQYKDLIGKPVVIRFNWKSYEKPRHANEWKGVFLGFFFGTADIEPHPRVRKGPNDIDIFSVSRDHTIKNIKSIELDPDYKE